MTGTLSRCCCNCQQLLPQCCYQLTCSNGGACHKHGTAEHTARIMLQVSVQVTEHASICCLLLLLLLLCWRCGFLLRRSSQPGWLAKRRRQARQQASTTCMAYAALLGC
jgi:hypothetical protein